MKAFIFPGQGAQFPGMGKNLFDTNIIAKKRFEQANAIWDLTLLKLCLVKIPKP